IEGATKPPDTGKTPSKKPVKSLKIERDSEAKAQVAYKLDCNNVADVAVPHHQVSATAAKRIAEAVSVLFEDFVSHHHPPLEANVATKDNSSDIKTLDVKHFLEDYSSLLVLVRSDSTYAGSEPSMYPRINTLFRFVTDAITAAHELMVESDPSLNEPLRKITAYEKTDRTPKGSDDSTQADIGLKLAKPPASIVREDDDDKTSIGDFPDYSDMLALVEVKTSLSMENDAYEQLYKYSRNIYACQPNRRFVWGLTVCGSTIRICLLNNDRLVVSDPIDIASTSGRKRFVEWLGYDPTLYYNSGANRWEVAVFDDKTEKTSTFEVLTCVRIADRTFGRHTRGFRCRRIDEKAPLDKTKLSVEELCALGNIIVKDSWAILSKEAGDTSRNEVELLRHINETLDTAAAEQLRGRFPRLVAGGVVKQRGENGVLFNDSLDSVFKKLGNDALEQLTPRAHNRLAMMPIGDHIRSVRSVDELIVVVADAMIVHDAIRKQCNILHRDISTNNILVGRTDGNVHGILIDFDCALRIDVAADREKRPVMTGTPPFMSIGNLSGSDVDRTELDDWESIIYVMCWLATIGVNGIDETERNLSEEEFSRFPIYSWRYGLYEQIADAKRNDMHSFDIFYSRVINNFMTDDS
ncbi:hypothetical protein EV178_006546, partial [Coemansia sp. RSA 1646]